ncbi:MAG: EF-P 5-aminopentanol modification-associated protein YfmF [Breznakia sp.]
MALKIIKEEKFKDITISLRFKNKTSKKHVIMKAILAELLASGCEKYPDKQSLSMHLNRLYGAIYMSSSTSYGNVHVLEFKTRILHSKFIEYKQDLLGEQIKLLENFILHPLFKDGMFVEKELEEAKRNILQHIKRNEDEPAQFAAYQASKLFGKEQALGIQVANYIDELKALNVSEVTQYYHEMLRDDSIDILVLGDVEKQTLTKHVKTLFAYDRIQAMKSSYVLKKTQEKKTYKFHKDISQTHIFMMFATHQNNQNEDFWQLYLANAILGMTPSSLLFREVRERHSLCYSVYSNILAYDGALLISTGIDPNNLEKTIALIHEQVEKVRKGDFSEQLLETTKRVLMNSLKNTKDDSNAYINMAYRSMLLHSENTIDDYIKMIESVGKEEIMEKMRQCELLGKVIVQKENVDEENYEC